MISMVSFLGFSLSDSVFAQPNWQKFEMIEGIKIFADTLSPEIYYHPPPNLVLALDQEGRPKVKLYSLLYSGQSWLGHSGLSIEKGQLTVNFTRDPTYELSLQRAHMALQERAAGKTVQLKPAPIARLDASFSLPIRGEDGQTLNIRLSGRIAGDDTSLKNQSVAENFLLTSHLDSQSLVILRNLFLDGNASASLNYTYIAANRGAEGETVLVSDSVPIGVDLRRWPELSVIRNMAHMARDGFPILQVICDDFLKDNPAILEKVVDIEAESVAGRRVAKTIIFTADPEAPMLVPVDFSYAVRVDRPYIYRTRTIDHDGEEITGPWVSVEDWVSLLDITDRDSKPITSHRNFESEVASPLNEAKP